MGAAVIAVMDRVEVEPAELVLLYAGCDLTDGHPTVPLALEIIRQTKPANFGALKRTVYGDWPMDEIPVSGQQMLNLAWQAALAKGWVRA